MESYYFLCECSRCLDVKSDQLKSSLLCSECNGCVPICTGGSCGNCCHTMDSSVIEQHKNLKSQISKIKSEPPCEDKMIYENLFNQAVAIFHSNDKDFLDLLNIGKSYERYQSQSKVIYVSQFLKIKIFKQVLYYEIGSTYI